MNTFAHHTLQAPSTLADKAMLVRLKRSQFHPYAADAKATTQVELANGVGAVGKFSKRLLKNSTRFNAVMQAFGAVYDYHIKHTLPWLDDGLRMLPSASYMEYTAEMRTLQSVAGRAVDELVQHWATEVTLDSLRLGPLFSADDYPGDVGSKFGINIQFLPVPSTGDFRVEIDPADAASLANAIKEAESGVARYIVDQLLEPLRAAAAKLSVPIGENGAIFRDSLIENLVEVTERLPRLNINNDPELARAIDEVRRTASQYRSNIDVLREAPVARETAANRVKELVDNLSGMF